MRLPCTSFGDGADVVSVQSKQPFRLPPLAVFLRCLHLMSDQHVSLGARTLLVTKGIATRSKDATRGSWHRY